jgi:spore maturation protein CgeB
MKILIFDTYYEGFLKSFWNNNNYLKTKNHSTQRQKIMNELFGTSDYYSSNLIKLGVQAQEVITNDKISQQTWAKEHIIHFSNRNVIDNLRLLPFLHYFIGRPQWIQDIAIAQIKKINPDIIYVQNLSIFNPETLSNIKNLGKILVGQIACRLPPQRYLDPYDLIITSFPHFVDRIRAFGIKSEYVKLAFEPKILKSIKPVTKKYNLTFIGSFTPYHHQGTRILESVARRFPIHVWGQGINYLSPTSPLRKHYHGEAWGKEMYQIIAQSKIVINRHISVSENYANNMRLYETTGMGTLLITDMKDNLADLFQLDKEIVTYRHSRDLFKNIKYYLNHPVEREKIAKAGQKRTLSEHTYSNRMKEIIKILNKYSFK